MLHPGEVGVALGRDAELPAHVVVLEGRVGEDVVGEVAVGALPEGGFARVAGAVEVHAPKQTLGRGQRKRRADKHY